jgi:molybdopterin biosynthesis enzyme
MFGVLPFVEIVCRRHAADDPDATAAAIGELAAGVDVLFVTGGVSMGHRDFVPGALRDLGARVLFHKLPQRPGKPILAAIFSNGLPVLALPGNPVSVLVTARRIGVPVVRRRAGCSPAAEVPPGVALAAEPTDPLDLWWHRPVRILPSGAASPVRSMGSGDIMAMASSDGFVEVPPGGAGEGPWPFYSWRV